MTLDLIDRLNQLNLDIPAEIQACLQELDELRIEHARMMKPSERVQALKHKVDIYLELMQYVYPKRKAIEMTEVSEEKEEYLLKWADETNDTEEIAPETQDPPAKTH